MTKQQQNSAAHEYLPSWLALLQAIPRYPNIAKTNLTVAFYVGAMRSNLGEQKVSAFQAKAELKDLLAEVIEGTPKGEIARIMRCNQIGQPVITFSKLDCGISATHTIESSAKTVTLVTDPEFSGDKQLTVDFLVDALFAEIGKAISAGRFSFRGGHYCSFSAQEREFVLDNRS